MKLAYLLIVCINLSLVACSNSKDGTTASSNAYTFSYLDNDGLINSSVVQFSTSTKSEDVEVKDETTGTTEVKKIQTTVYEPVIYQTQFLKMCEQSSKAISNIGKVKSEYIINSTSESCAGIEQPIYVGLIDLRAIVLKNLPESEKMTSDTKADIFLALPLRLVTSARVVEVNLPSLPMIIIFDLQSMAVRGFSEKQNTSKGTAVTAQINSAHKLNVLNKSKYDRLVTALQNAGLYGKTKLTTEEQAKIRQIAAEFI